jgi:pyruvate/2-oxoglutarate dehydrogenase complex dihydrolipoamide acyltransferase (E2) component
MAYKVLPFPKIRILIAENLRKTRTKNNISLFIEADITMLSALKAEKIKNGESFSIPVYILYCLGQLLQRHPILISMRKGNKLIQFDQADIMTIVEREHEGNSKVPMAIIVRDAGQKSYLQIVEEIRKAQVTDPNRISEVKQRRKLLSYPAWLIRLAVSYFQSDPVRYCKYYGNASFTSPVRNKDERFAIATHISSCTVSLLLNNTYKKVVKTESGFEERVFKGFTFVVDHDILDGAQGMRIASEFCSLVENCYGIT